MATTHGLPDVLLASDNAILKINALCMCITEYTNLQLCFGDFKYLNLT